MRLLLVSATSFEIGPFLNELEKNFERKELNVYKRGNTEIKICISGIGIMQTAYTVLESVLESKPDFALQAGVAGTFELHHSLGELVLVKSEVLADLGAEDHHEFLDVFDLGLLQENDSIFEGRKLVNPISIEKSNLDLPFVSSITVNSTSGNSNTIELRNKKYNCTIESMEGAAFHFVCLKKKVQFLQLRCISNYIEPRDKSKWEMKMAITNLNKWLIEKIIDKEDLTINL